MVTSGQKLLSVEATAKHFGVSTDTIRGWLKRGTLPAKKVGRRVFVEESAVSNLSERRPAGRGGK